MKTRLVVLVVLCLMFAMPGAAHACTESWGLEWVQLVVAGAKYADAYDRYSQGRITRAQLVDEAAPLISYVADVIDDIMGQEACDRKVAEAKDMILEVARAFRVAMIVCQVYHIVSH